MPTNLMLMAGMQDSVLRLVCWLPFSPRKGCVLLSLLSRSVTGSTTDFGSVSFGSIPDGKTFKKGEKC